jgi:hypothetical protein
VGEGQGEVPIENLIAALLGHKVLKNNPTVQTPDFSMPGNPLTCVKSNALVRINASRQIRRNTHSYSIDENAEG